VSRNRRSHLQVKNPWLVATIHSFVPQRDLPMENADMTDKEI
jgi:hypothetical protein